MRESASVHARRRSVSLLVSILAGLIIAADVAMAASAVSPDNLVPTGNYAPVCDEGTYEGGGTVCLTDNSSVYFFMDRSRGGELEEVDKDVVRDMLRMYRRTDLAFGYDSTPKFDGSGETDIIYREAPVPGDAEGIAYCNDDSPNPSYECDQQYVRIQGGGWYSQGLSCHETGHAVGLVHGRQTYPAYPNDHGGFQGCMVTPVTRSENLGSHNQDIIDEWYPRPN